MFVDFVSAPCLCIYITTNYKYLQTKLTTKLQVDLSSNGRVKFDGAPHQLNDATE